MRSYYFTTGVCWPRNSIRVGTISTAVDICNMAYLPGERMMLSCPLSYVKQTSLGCPRKHLNKTRQTDIWQTQSLHQRVYLLYLPVQMDGAMPITKSQVVQYIMCFNMYGCMLSPCSYVIEPFLGRTNTQVQHHSLPGLHLWLYMTVYGSCPHDRMWQLQDSAYQG